ncbi:hypothetical protein [Rhizobacter sp. OV335]|uniref:hypothetical protein n=1 Tax=Rhizobacter sp. OV335 TaxID=1500264 RepID=UPI001161327D|nr:hypothetical protein [Rhizobacter sp. OV335]
MSFLVSWARRAAAALVSVRGIVSTLDAEKNDRSFLTLPGLAPAGESLSFGAQMKVTKAKSLNATPYGSFWPAADNTATPLRIQP